MDTLAVYICLVSKTKYSFKSGLFFPNWHITFGCLMGTKKCFDFPRMAEILICKVLWVAQVCTIDYYPVDAAVFLFGLILTCWTMWTVVVFSKAIWYKTSALLFELQIFGLKFLNYDTCEVIVAKYIIYFSKPCCYDFWWAFTGTQAYDASVLLPCELWNDRRPHLGNTSYMWCFFYPIFFLFSPLRIGNVVVLHLETRFRFSSIQ